jgi:hypothetical protein
MALRVYHCQHESSRAPIQPYWHFRSTGRLPP